VVEKEYMARVRAARGDIFTQWEEVARGRAVTTHTAATGTAEQTELERAA
jgi:hypothetical protein